MTFLMASPICGAAPSFITTVQVIPALINTPGGTSVRRKGSAGAKDVSFPPSRVRELPIARSIPSLTGIVKWVHLGNRNSRSAF
jgi:hypothetical protein